MLIDIAGPAESGEQCCASVNMGPVIFMCIEVGNSWGAS